jgi:hypothetical protein
MVGSCKKSVENKGTEMKIALKFKGKRRVGWPRRKWITPGISQYQGERENWQESRKEILCEGKIHWRLHP